MAAGRIVIPGWMPALDSNGVPIANARMFFYQNNTTTLATVYTDPTMTTPLTNPIVANAAGQWPSVWADTENLFSVTVDANYGPAGVPFTFDDISPSTSTGGGGGSGGVNKGGWNADTNTPAITSGDGVDGDFYTVTVEGGTIIDGAGPWDVGDQILFVSGAWTRVMAPLLAINGSNIPPSVESTPSGALPLRQAQNMFFITPEDFGAVGDGVADDTLAIQRAITARRAAGAVLQFARKDYRFTSPLVDFGDYMSWVGDGTSALVWDGSTSATPVTWGQPGSELRFPHISGIKIATKKNMTSGWMAVVHAPARGLIEDITIHGIDGGGLYGGRPYDGIYFNGYSYTKVSNLEAGGASGSRIGVGIRGIPGGAQAGLWFYGGTRLGGFDYLVQIGGGNGGLYFNDTDVIGAFKACVLQNNAYEAQNNREVFWSGTVSIDTGGTEGCYIIDQNAGTCLVVFDGTWICSGQGTLSGPGPAPGIGGGLYLKRGPDTRLIADGVYLHNHGGDAVRIDETDCEVMISGMIVNNKGYGINRTAANIRAHCDGVVFRQNLLGDQSPDFPPVSYLDYDRGRFRDLRVQSGGFVNMDNNFYCRIQAGNPVISFDSSDYIEYLRGSNILNVRINAGTPLVITETRGIGINGTPPIFPVYINGTTDGSGVASGSLPYAQSTILYGFVTVENGNGTFSRSLQVQGNGSNYTTAGDAGTASKPYKGLVWVMT